MMEYSKEDLKDLYDGKLPWGRVKQVMSHPKDDDRFDKYIEILQERVPWSERILLPLGEHLYVVEKDRERIVKCDCGQEFGDYRRNWKLSALIFARDDYEKLHEIYPGIRSPNPDFCEVREYYCPGCAALLKVESVPIGYPIIFDFLPDIDAFYREWLDRPLSEEKEFKDMSYEVTRAWGLRQD
ncbi:MAG: acetone carboxylase subunit gamma [Chloroflexi bacterium]|nr:acetone carboxylase subunit gamma [Chloroflexota bacterium]